MRNLFVIFFVFYTLVPAKALDLLEDYDPLSPTVIQRKLRTGVKDTVQSGIGLLAISTFWEASELMYPSKFAPNGWDYQLLSLPTVRALFLAQGLDGMSTIVSVLKSSFVHDLSTEGMVSVNTLSPINVFNLVEDYSDLSPQKVQYLLGQGVYKMGLALMGAGVAKVMEFAYPNEDLPLTTLRYCILLETTVGLRNILSALNYKLNNTNALLPNERGRAGTKRKIIQGCIELTLATFIYAHHASFMMLRAASSNSFESLYIEMGGPAFSILGVVSFGYKGLKNIVSGILGW